MIYFCVYMRAGARRVQKRMLGSLQLKFQAVVSPLMWVLRTNMVLCKESVHTFLPVERDYP